MNKTQEAIRHLSSRKNNISCNGRDGMLLLLDELGFDKADGQGNHKIFTHQRLSQESSHNPELVPFVTLPLDCGHRPGQPMKLPYIVRVIKTLKNYEEIIERILCE